MLQIRVLNIAKDRKQCSCVVDEVQIDINHLMIISNHFTAIFYFCNFHHHYNIHKQHRCFIFPRSKVLFQLSFSQMYFHHLVLGKVLQATDRRKVTFLDVLIECDQKTVVSNAAVASVSTIIYCSSQRNLLGPILSERTVERWSVMDRKQFEDDSDLPCHGGVSSNMDFLLSSLRHKV